MGGITNVNAALCRALHLGCSFERDVRLQARPAPSSAPPRPGAGRAPSPGQEGQGGTHAQVTGSKMHPKEPEMAFKGTNGGSPERRAVRWPTLYPTGRTGRRWPPRRASDSARCPSDHSKHLLIENKEMSHNCNRLQRSQHRVFTL